MRKFPLLLLICINLQLSNAQHNNYKLSVSGAFQIPEIEVPLKQFSCDTSGIVSVSGFVPYTFTCDLFSHDLKLIDTRKADLKGMLDKGLSMHNFIQLKDHTYLFLCNYQEKTRSEGISVLEFFPRDLEFAESSRDLFLSAKKVRMQSAYPTMNDGRSADEQVQLSPYSGSHGLFVSEDKTKFLCTYGLVETDMKEGFEKEKVGIQVFDQDLNKLWGGEYMIPYAKDKVETLEHVLGNDGKVYMLARVYNRSIKKFQADGRPDFHHEVLVYEKGEPAPYIIQMDAEDHFPVAQRFYETQGRQLVFGGIFSGKADKRMKGLFLSKININSDGYGKVQKYQYAIPVEMLNAEQLKQGGQNAELENMELREIRSPEDGSVYISIEEYSVYLKSDKFNTRAGAIVVLRLDAEGNLNWARKVSKVQENPTKLGYQLSFSSVLSGDDLHLFFYDHPDNFSLQNGQLPAVFRTGASGELVGVRIGKDGMMEKYRLNTADISAMGIRYFNLAGQNDLLRVETGGQQGRMVMLRVE